MKLNNVHHDIVIPKWVEKVLIIVLFVLMIWDVIVVAKSTFASSPLICYLCFEGFIIASILAILYETKQFVEHKDLVFKTFTIVFDISAICLVAISIIYSFGWIYTIFFGIQVISLSCIVIDTHINMEKSYMYGMGIFNSTFLNLILIAFKLKSINERINMTSLIITNMFLAINLIVMLYARYHYRPVSKDTVKEDTEK